jgi:threonine/homoserine/homoserine lactone efflux protein
MSLSTWLLYVAAVFVLTVTPGPSVLMVIATSVNRGYRQALLAALGSTCAIVGIMTLSALGLGAALAASEVLFSWIKWGGAAYLAYLGVMALLASRRDAPMSPARPDDGASASSSFTSGLLVGASNPKALVFFAALFPQFVDPAQPQGMQYLVLGATFVSFELFWLCSYASLGARATQWLSRPGRMRQFNRATGGVFLVAAGLLASTRRAAG